MEHALELEAADVSFERPCLPFYVLRSRCIILAFRELEQLCGIGDSLACAVQLRHLARQTGPFAPQLLRPLGLRPDLRIFELAADLLEALFLAVVFKETPEGS